MLAKRIKNLLRKWKERLAASTIPATNSHSQPNSPQNFSQGSSDTQFMTQHSQSPPNSSSQQSSASRIVNGPTSFKNLLPKSQQQNHQQHHNLRAVTSPAAPTQPHIYQNGIELSTSTSSLLGKRKMLIDGSSNGADIDENSNQSRKKMMKKTNSGGIAPLTFNANNNNNNNHNNNSNSSNNSIFHNNQQIINKSHSNVPVLQQNHHQQHPQQQLPLPLPPQQPPQLQQPILKPPLQLQQPQAPPPQLLQETLAQPKKRGRRKGSKGIDSQLNGIVPDFQAEIQQKIALSAGKRNKTTFELQQMLESHQNTSMSWTNGDLDSSSLDRGSFKKIL